MPEPILTPHDIEAPPDPRGEIDVLRDFQTAATTLRRTLASLPASVQRDLALVHQGQAQLHVARRILELERGEASQ